MTDRDNDLAATLQEATENIGVHMAKHLHQLTGEKKLCIGGGVALNSVMNYKILKETPFEEVFIYPASSDAGTAAGAALYHYFSVLGHPKKPVNPSAYLGPVYSDEACEQAFKQFNLKYTRLSDVAATTKYAATALSQGKILGWFQGRMEIGPRALGNRSIICQPYPDEMKAVLNDRVKHREGFRPFAPSAKIERYQEFFEIATPSPYMLLVCDTKKDKLQQLSAITHVDNTARLQTVSRSDNPVYWQLIDEYEKLTGIPVILNTSFNVRGEPIVCTPADAIKCYLGTHMDMLILGNLVAEKPGGQA
jgi:carbamoyltransferase